MRYLSVCSGIEAATVAWHPLGWQPVGFSEIEKFPSAVLAHHYPNTPNYGDMTQHEQWPESNLDVLVGGTPCQSFSVAGLRQGMADPRGNLALVYLAIAAQRRPRWLVWENVPGVLSSNGGRDFGAILGAMVKLGYGVAWRVLDAQFFGVPQRRRRVFIVGRLGDWRSAAEVLFEPESLLRNPAPRREPREEIAASPAHSLRGRGFDASEDGTGRGTPLVPEIAGTFKACADSGGWSNSADHAAAGHMIPEVASALLAGAPNGGPAQGARSGHAKEATLIPEVANPLTARMYKGINTTLDEGQTPIPVAFHPTQDPISSDDGTCHALGTGSKQGCATAAIANRMAVRRLTPLECERLQGFPDGYTDIPGASDSARYKALGNSMAVPVMRWIGERITDP